MNLLPFTKFSNGMKKERKRKRKKVYFIQFIKQLAMQMHAVTIISPYVYKSKLPQLWLYVSTLDDDDSAMHNFNVCVSVYSSLKITKNINNPFLNGKCAALWEKNICFHSQLNPIKCGWRAADT